jgi:uncharacterized protein (TIGR03085 family)
VPASIASVPSYAAHERSALADLLAELGPDEPTLCAGWQTRDLAAHIILRERRPLAALGIVLPALAEHNRQVQARMAKRDWPRLVAMVRHRPSANALIDEALNRVELFVHHEDVRRAQPDWTPRELDHGHAAALWSRVRGQGRLVLRRTPAAVTVEAPGFGSTTGGRGGPAVTLKGAPGELLLFLFGRQAHAVVELTGPEAVVSRMQTAHYGI